MADKESKVTAHGKDSGSIELRRQIVEGKELFAFSKVLGVLGPCDGQMDGASCGPGCTCRGGQPWYDHNGITNLGIVLDK